MKLEYQNVGEKCTKKKKEKRKRKRGDSCLAFLTTSLLLQIYSLTDANYRAFPHRLIKPLSPITSKAAPNKNHLVPSLLVALLALALSTAVFCLVSSPNSMLKMAMSPSKSYKMLIAICW